MRPSAVMVSPRPATVPSRKTSKIVVSVHCLVAKLLPGTPPRRRRVTGRNPPGQGAWATDHDASYDQV